MVGVRATLSDDAELVAQLRRANTGLREVITTQAVQIETLTGPVAALSAQLAAQAERIALQARTPFLPLLLRSQAGRAGVEVAAGRDHYLLRAIAAGRCVLAGTALRVDGLLCGDQFTGARLAAAGLIVASTSGLALTPAGRAAIGIV